MTEEQKRFFEEHFKFTDESDPFYFTDLMDRYQNNPSAVAIKPDPNYPDPDAEKLGKPKDLEWISVPLVVAGKLYGGLAADRRRANRFDLRLMSWGDGSMVPTSGKSLVVVGTDHDDLLRIRIFDATGNRLPDKDETQIPDQVTHIGSLKQQIAGLQFPYVLNEDEKDRAMEQVSRIVDLTCIDPTRRPITADDRQAMNQLGALASQAFSIHEQVGMLKIDPMVKLYKSVLDEPSREIVQKRLLRFITHDEGGLGFSRALYLTINRESSRFTFKEGVGQTSEEKFAKVATDNRFKPLEEVLEEASVSCDQDLYTALEAAALEVTTLLRNEIDQDEKERKATKITTEMLPALETRLGKGSNALLIARVWGSSESDPTGLIVVDRAWQREAIGDSDRARLWTFAQAAGRILLVHELKQELDNLRERESLVREKESLVKLARLLSYSINVPAGKINLLFSWKNDFINRICNIMQNEGGGARHQIEKDQYLLRTLAKDASKLASKVLELNLLQESNVTCKRKDVRMIVEKAIKETNYLGGYTIKISNKCKSIELPLPEGHLVLAIKQLIDNAVAACIAANANEVNPKTATPRVVIVDRKYDTQRLQIVVRDNGTGLSKQYKDNIKKNRCFAREDVQHLGFGLNIVHCVAVLHQGSIRLEGRPSGGCRATLTITIPQK